MMRRGPLSDTPVEALLEAAAAERANGVIQLHGPTEVLVYLIEGDLYLAEPAGEPPLEQRLLAAGLLSTEQIERHTEPGDEGPYLALALDTDPSIDEDGIGNWLLDLTASTISSFIGVQEGEYELDPYGNHPAGILASWTPQEVLDRGRRLRVRAERAEAKRRAEEQQRAEAERLEAEQRAEAERLEAEQRAELDQRAELEHGSEVSTQSGDRATDEAAAEDGAHGTAIPLPPAGDGTVVDSAPAESDGSVAGAESPPTVAEPITGNVLVVASDAVPDGVVRVGLTALEWRIVVAAARGISLNDLVRRLDVDAAVVEAAVAELAQQGLLATVG